MRSAIPRVFLDANIWFSASYGSHNCQTILDAFLKEQIIASISQQVLEEIIRNIRQKLPARLLTFQSFIANNPPLILPDPPSIPKNIKDLINRYDQPIFASAIFGKVDYFVTGNIKHFDRAKLEKLTKIKILTPKETVSQLQLE